MKRSFYRTMIPFYVLVIIGLLSAAYYGSRAVSVYSQSVFTQKRTCVVIDAGHGGEDGGAISVTGVSESNINLEIAQKTKDLMNLLGIKTYMIRTDDRSIYTKGETLSAKKVSDLKERVRIVNETDNALLVSIHQNYFSDERYSGLQAFYPTTAGSKDLAIQIQDCAKKVLNKTNNRNVKQTKGIYLMDNINCTAVLVECGFLSNYSEESLLRSDTYQKCLAGVIATSISNYLDQ